jgi:predicted restriction endonuclease
MFDKAAFTVSEKLLCEVASYNMVKGVTSNEELDRIFDEEAKTEA